MNISVITPFYRGNEYLSGYVEMLRQNASHLKKTDRLEVLVVNDSPNVPVVGIPDQPETEDDPANGASPAFRVLTHPENAGIHASRLQGLAAASGDWILFLDQDDALAPDALAQWKRTVERQTAQSGRQPDAVVCNARLMQRDGTSLLWFRTDAHWALLNDPEVWVQVGTQIVSPGQVLLRRDAVPASWGNRICRVNGSDDYYLWLLLLAAGKRFDTLKEPLYIHRYTGANLSEDTRRTDASTQEFLSFLEEDPAFPPRLCRTLRTMVVWKAAFRAGGKGTKLLEAAKHPCLLWANLRYKQATKTAYGFNR